MTNEEKGGIIICVPIEIGAIYAGMAELADALDSGSSGGNFVQVQVLLPAPNNKGWANAHPLLFYVDYIRRASANSKEFDGFREGKKQSKQCVGESPSSSCYPHQTKGGTQQRAVFFSIKTKKLKK